MMKRVMGILLLGILMSTTLTAQRGGKPLGERPKGKISGAVKDSLTEQAVEYANIVIYSLRDSSMVTGTVTDMQGKFVVDNVPFGRYYATADFIGYRKKQLGEIMVGPRNPSPDVGIIELPQASYGLDEVEVVADKMAFEYRIDKKVVNVSQDLNAAGGTAADVLENTPSVDVDIEGNVSLRGSGNFQVLINGRPSVLQGSDALQQMPARAIESIEIITNPSAKYDPDGTAGIINVIMKKEEEGGLTGMVNASIGTNNKYRGNVLLNYKLSNFNIIAGLDYRNDEYHMERETERISTFNDTTTFLESTGDRVMNRGGVSGRLGFDWYLSDKTTLGLIGRLGEYEFGFSNQGRNHEWSLPADSNIYFYSESEMSRPRTFYSLNANLSHQFDTEGHKLIGSLYWSGREGESADKSFEWYTDENWFVQETLSEINTTEVDNSTEFRMNLDYTRPFSKVSKLETGLQARIEDDTEDYSFEEYVEGYGWQINDLYSSRSDYSRDIYSAYATFTDELFGIGYQLGLRGEYTNRLITDQQSLQEYSIDRLDYFPSLHLSKQLPNDNQLMLSYSRRIDRPRGRDLDPFKRYMDVNNIWQGNPGIKPEYVNSYEFGYLKKWGSSFLSLESFYRHTLNKITRILSPLEEGVILHTVENLNQDHQIGGELMLSHDFGKKLNVNLNGSLYYYKLEGDEQTRDVTRESTNWNARFSTTWKFLPTSRLQARLGYRGPSVTVQGTGEGMLMSDLALRHDFWERKASVTLQVRDLFGTMKREFTTDLDNLYEHTIMQRESQIVQLSLSYRINNYKPERRQSENGGEDAQEMDYGY